MDIRLMSSNKPLCRTHETHAPGHRRVLLCGCRLTSTAARPPNCGVRLHVKPVAAVPVLLLSTGLGVAQPTWVISVEDRKSNTVDTNGDSDEVTVRFTNGTAYRIPLYRAKPISVLRG